MIRHKSVNIICMAIVAATLMTTVAFMNGSKLGVISASEQPKYAEKLFSTDRVHSIDIEVDDAAWQKMLEEAQKEEYIEVTVTIDGDEIRGVGLRPKGNSSLSMIARSDSDRYSFKIEFDHYAGSISYYGLDKLVLNNIAQDNTYMKDYITYQMMNEMGAIAPLSSFIWVTVNGEDRGLYLAVEGIEESFARRVYGKDFGEIYKPDTMDLNDIGNMQRDGNNNREMPLANGEKGAMPDPDRMPRMPDMGDENGTLPDAGNRPQMPGLSGENGLMPGIGPNMDPRGKGGMAAGGTSLVYIDDNPERYPAIFDNAVFKVSASDKKRLIESLKQLNENDDIDQVVDVDEVIRYFAVHNFVLNADSYTGSFTHNYYLVEQDGKLSMIAWDYNLAFGGMGDMGKFPDENRAINQTTHDAWPDRAASYVNYPIDSPMMSGTIEDKPMIAWIFSNEKYLDQYHEVYAEYVAYIEGGAFALLFDQAVSLIAPYIAQDPTAFCTYQEFLLASSTLREFCLLRAESIRKQLDGMIASTQNGQVETNQANFVDASGIDLDAMGSNAMGFSRAR